MDTNVYERRLVLFLDFLGFKELIDRTSDDSKLVAKIISAMNHLKELADETEFYKTQRVTQFSDCMVISYQVNEQSAVFDLISDIGFFLVDLVGRGFLLRGAVTVGALLHTENHLLGPAMVRAYHLESKVAKYPRVIVDDDVLTTARANPARHHDGDDELEYVNGFLRKDEDDILFVDYVSWNAVVAKIGADNEEYPSYLQDLSELIGAGLKHQDPQVQEKYLWLHRQYLAAIKVFEETPSDHDSRLQYQEMYDDVLSLPRFNDEADEATRKCDEAKRNRGVRR